MGTRKKVVVGYAISLSACVGQGRPKDDELTPDDESVVAESLQALASEDSEADAGLAIDPRRSLVVTEEPILERFSFERVMKQLVSQSSARGLTPAKLFQQWWDTQNPAPGVTQGPHCDDEIDGDGRALLNGYPYTCRPAPAEGAQASCDPFRDEACRYIPIGLFNRFDLADEEGAHCGEHRIVFAKQSGQTNNRDRNLLIFEATLPNPHPERGLEGCREIASMWASLSRIDSVKKRADLLERFYFRGLGRDVRPVVHIDHYGNNPEGLGQIRTNQFMQDGLEARAWSLREFKLVSGCTQRREGRRTKRECTLEVVPDTVKGNPFAPLFAERRTHRERAPFQAEFLEQVDSLAAAELTSIGMTVDDRYNTGESDASRGSYGDYAVYFADEGTFASDIQERLDTLGSDLTPTDIVARAQTQSCAGCHRLSNDVELGGGLKWPASLGFTHVDERKTEQVDGVTRFVISDALTDVFLPHRKQVIEDFMARRPRKPTRGHAHHRHTLGRSPSHG